MPPVSTIFLRGADRNQVNELEQRLTKVAQGAAMMTETSVDWEIKAGCYDVLPNTALNWLMHSQTEIAGEMVFTSDEEKFAEEPCQTVDPSVMAAAKQNSLLYAGDGSRKLDPGFYHNLKHLGLSMGGSTDVGDVSWIVPLGQIITTCAPLGVQVHTWQATASFGSSIGMKGMHHAAKVMALTGYDLLLNKDGILDKAKAEFKKVRKEIRINPEFRQMLKPPVKNDPVPIPVG